VLIHFIRKFIPAFILSFFIFLIAINPVIAETGTHLGVGDISHQISIIDSILAQNGAGAGFPVTVMVDSNTASSDVQKLADAIKKHNYFPIVRINKTCNITTEQSITIVQIVKQAFGDNVVITFGNEVNNQERECSDWNQYAQNYLEVKDAGNISPSALDWYMGNPTFDADKFLNDSGLRAEYNVAEPRTANAYGCINESKESCDPDTTNTQEVGMTGITTDKNFYLTEFSLSPGGSSPPDLDLNNVLDFIKNRASATGATHVTPLVRNVCENLREEGEWLIYVKGKLFTSKGTKIDPDSCDTLLEEQLMRDLNKYYLYPLILNPEESLNDTGDFVDTLIWNLVYDQGYEVHCPSPSLIISKRVVGEMKKYFELHPGPVVMSGQGSYKANLSEAKVPMFRGSEKETLTDKTSSFEGYFGSLDLDASELDSSELAAGVAHSLLTKEQQCTIKVNNLITAQQMCEKLDDQNTLVNPETCALHEKIPKTDYYIYSSEVKSHNGKKSLLNAYLKAYEDGVGCSEFSKSWNSKLDIDQDEFEEIQVAIESMSLNLDKVYRLAFFIIAPLQDLNESLETRCAAAGNGNNPEDRFCFLSRHIGSEGSSGQINTKNIKKHSPMFVAFKIPDLATNKSYSFPLWKDAADLTTSAIRSPEQNDYVKKEIEKAREELLTDVKAAQSIRKHGTEEQKASLVINCSGMPSCDCAHGAGCELRKALVDIINGTDQTCENIDPNPLGAVEKAGDIFSPAQVLPAVGNEFKSPFWLEVPPTQKSSDPWRWGLKIKDFSDGIKKISSGGKQGVQVRTLVVSPIGTNMEYINEALKIFFTLDGFEAMVANNCIPDSENNCGLVPIYYPLEDAKFNFKDKATKSFYDPSKDCPEDEFGIEQIPCDNNSWGIELDDNNVGIKIKGAELGWMIKKVQQSLAALGSKTHGYLESCQRTEDMFLGRCPGGEEDDVFAEAEDMEKFNLCGQITDNNRAYEYCKACENRGGVWTAVGCAQTKAESIVKMFIKIGISIGGGIALLSILLGAFKLTTSQGDPKQVEEAKSLISSAIIGLIFILFSVVIIQFIGVQLFRIPGFGE